MVFYPGQVLWYVPYNHDFSPRLVVYVGVCKTYPTSSIVRRLGKEETFLAGTDFLTNNLKGKVNANQPAK